MEYKVLLESILENLDEGVFVVDTNAKVTFFNEPASDVAGVDPDEVIGKNILEIFPGLTKESSTFYQVLRSKEPMIDYVQAYHNNRGEIVKTVTSTIPLFKDGIIVGAMELYRPLDSYSELTERINMLKVARDSQEPFHSQFDRNAFDSGDSAHQKRNKSSRQNGTKYTLDHMIGRSPSILNLKEMAKRVADSNSPILVYGETGTGKELVVQGIHNASKKRSSHPFIALNCAAIPATLLEGILFGTSSGSFTGAKDKAGLFELACGGTLFLDEINSMSMELQAKLLRVIQEGVVRRVGDGKTIDVDVRVVASSNVEPLEAVHAGQLRMDLYYRLNVIALNISPLRDRKEDIPQLVSSFISQFNQKLGKSVISYEADFIEFLMSYHWPGNVRELSCVVERIMNFTLASTLRYEDVPEELVVRFKELENHQNFGMSDNLGISEKSSVEIHSSNFTSMNAIDGSLKDRMNAVERQIILEAIRSAKGNCAEAARHLGVPRQTMHNKIKKHGIKLESAIL